ncbi:radical SAM protein [Bdellovibrio sp. SKB1291214]|uniref:radical SAM/SPASM domain-containing protein n=1 Tax=Bdellovibrio sp. SKB1291214 TaxID=1732569 RepID=UPI000B515312|nr:radical SAM protein [Bdellovibrio sp. SKB1291214]UYL08774.1 radical SAM protein [Bdellovibrio sp. SKB1291214]
MEIRRQNDIIAFRAPGESPVAFHARNLEVADISEELWGEMNSPSDDSLQSVLIDWNDEINPDVTTTQVAREIRSLTINVTQICNLKCTYCAAGGDGTYGSPQTKINIEKTLPQLKFFLDRLPDTGIFRISFIGGEPLLYPEGIRAIANYVKLMTAGRNLTTRFSIVTNGTLLTDENIALLEEIKCNVSVSIDGAAERNDVARPMKNGQGSTAVVIEGLHKLFARKEKLGSITLHGVFTASNRNVVEAYKFYCQFPADAYEFTYSVSDMNQEASDLFTREMTLIAAMAYNAGGEAALRKISFFNRVFQALDEQRRTENFCGAGKSLLVVDARNNLFTCPWDVGNSAEKVGQGTEVSPQSLDKYSQNLIEQNNCQTCWARFLCGGGCMFVHKEATGSKNQKNGQFCQRQRSLAATAILYFKKSRQTDNQEDSEYGKH